MHCRTTGSLSCAGADEMATPFYSHQAWKGSGSSEYRLNTEGRLLSKGSPTRWRIDDLTDTGRTAESPEIAIARGAPESRMLTHSVNFLNILG